jgi:hypothetical protein
MPGLTCSPAPSRTLRVTIFVGLIFYAAFRHPLLKRLVRFECGPDSLMRTDDCTDAFSRYFEPRVYQRNPAHLYLPRPVIHPRPERTQAPKMGHTDSSSEALCENIPRVDGHATALTATMNFRFSPSREFEPGLLEMMIARQGVGNVAFVHCNE